MGDLEERQTAALGMAVIVGGIAVPLLIGLPLLFLSGWLTLLGVHNVHGMLWGWLSTRSTYTSANGTHVAYGISKFVPVYFLSVVTLYIIYQLIELFNGLFQVFKDALS